MKSLKLLDFDALNPADCESCGHQELGTLTFKHHVTRYCLMCANAMDDVKMTAHVFSTLVLAQERIIAAVESAFDDAKGNFLS
jgi:transcription elongation factor Elf1